MRLHLGCGTVYLIDYINIDTILNPRARDASLRPDLVDRWATTKENYYGKQGKLDLGHVNNSEFPVDAFSDITELQYPDASIEEILTVQTLEHLTLGQVKTALTSWYRLLVPNGKLEIVVPDIGQMIQLILDAETLVLRQEAVRLVFGTRKSNLFYHHYGYTPEGLSALLVEHGFVIQTCTTSLINSYPSFKVVATKD